MFSISVDESLPTELEIVIFALRPEVFSVAVTLRIPLTSTSNTTSRTASPALEDRELDRLLIVRDSSEGSLLDCWYGLTTWNHRSKDIAFHCNA